MTDERSTSWALFRKSAEDLAVKLGEVPSPEAAGMAREARDLAAVFQSWDKTRPANETRIAAIHQLFDLNRRAMDFLSRQSRPSFRVQPPSSRNGGPSSR